MYCGVLIFEGNQNTIRFHLCSILMLGNMHQQLANYFTNYHDESTQAAPVTATESKLAANFARGKFCARKLALILRKQ